MTEQIQKLRDLTGAGVMECQKALKDTEGNIDAAVKLIHERGFAKAVKKGDRSTGAGVLASYIHNERVGVLLDVRCETDFAARSAPFQQLAHELAMQVAAMNPESTNELLKGEYIKDPTITVDEFIKRNIARIGENVKVERFTRYEL